MKKEFEDYKIIHDFMYPNDPLKKWIDETNFIDHFKDDWNELMPVVEKIEDFIFENDEYYNFNILGGCYVIVISSHGNELITSDTGESKLECTYRAAVEFIQWYNKNHIL